MASIAVTKKPRGRPRTGIGRNVGLRLYADMEEAIEAWAADQPDKPSRVEAIRRILDDYLKAKGYLRTSAA